MPRRLPAIGLDMSDQPAQTRAFTRVLHRRYALYTVGVVAFIAALAALEAHGWSRTWIGTTFLIGTVVVYAAIGLGARTTDQGEYYVAGRRVPAFYNGMATAADWMSAASFIGTAGVLYLHGFAGLAYILGWTGGYCLVAMLLAPYLRRSGFFTLPDFLAARYGGLAPRLIGIGASVLVCFVYVVVQIYGVGLITSHLTGFNFEVGIFVGLGGVLVCSFLGGMRAVTWTQVAQYIVLIIAFLTPVFWLSVKQTGTAWPPLGYGMQLEGIAEREQRLEQDPAELEVRRLMAARAADQARKLANVPAAMEEDRERLAAEVSLLRRDGDASRALQQAERRLTALPSSEAAAAAQYQRAYEQAQRMASPLAGMAPHAVPFASGDPAGTPRERASFADERLNFMALVACLMLGTAAMPHVLTRYCTTPTTSEARRSVAWSLFFIALLYLAAPALAAIVKYEVLTHLIGQPFSALPGWISRWSRLDPSLVSVEDVNGDGVLQLAELWLGQDVIVLAAPEIGGLPLVVTYLVAAGGLAAALSTADGLLLTISNALSHDLYYRVFRPQARAIRRVMLSKFLVLLVALAAAYLAAQRTADILQFVSVAFSIAASAFFPALVLGIFWRGATRLGATCGMLTGLATALGYLLLTHARLRGLLGWPEVGAGARWWGIDPVAAGVFGVPIGLVTIAVVSWIEHALRPQGDPASDQAAIDRMRDPRRDGAFEDSLY